MKSSAGIGAGYVIFGIHVGLTGSAKANGYTVS